MNQPTFRKPTNSTLQPTRDVGRNKLKYAKEAQKICQLIPQKIFLENLFYTGWAKKTIFVKVLAQALAQALAQ